VRILRMTPGNRHVEAAALRSQAVLEAMRGRAEAARGIIATCRTTLEELGLPLELHDLDLHAGIVELLAGDAPAAEAALRAAHDGLRRLGMQAAAAQAAALLARAVLMQDPPTRDDEALELTAYAERHGGEDLKTAIAWCGVRAEALAGRGEGALALALARRAVARAEPTDALADKADAFMSLAAVLRRCGDEAQAAAAATRARDLYAEKDHTVGVARARAAIGHRAPEAPARDEPPADRPDAALRRPVAVAVAARHADALAGLDDGETAVSVVADGDAYEVLVERHGAPVARERFEDAAAALERFDARCLDEWDCTLSPHAPAPIAPGVVRRVARHNRAVNARDWAAVAAMYPGGFVREDDRRMGWETILSPDEHVADLRALAEVSPDARLHVELLLGRGTDDEFVNGLILHASGRHREGGGPFEIRLGQVIRRQRGEPARGRLVPDDPAAVLAAAEELAAAALPLRRPVPEASLHELAAWAGAAADPDGVALRELYDADDYVMVDHRAMGAGAAGGRDEGLAQIAVIHRSATQLRWEPEPLAGLGDGESLVTAARFVVHGRAADGGGAFEGAYALVTVSRGGVFRRAELFGHDDRAAVLARFDELCAEAFGGVTLSPHARAPVAPAVVRRSTAWLRAYNAHDWDAMRDLVDPDVIQVDRRDVSTPVARGVDDYLSGLRAGAELAGRARSEVLAGVEAAGRRVGGVTVVIEGAVPGEGGPFEIRLGAVAVMAGDRTVASEILDDDPVAVLARVDELTAAPGAQSACEAAVAAADARDWAALRARLADDYTGIDRRDGRWERHSGPDDAVALWRAVAGDAHVALEPLAATDHACAGVVRADGAVAFAFASRVRDGRIARGELFDDPTAALRRHAELDAAAAAARAVAPATRDAFRAWADAFNARDWDAHHALHTDDYVEHDRRRAAAAPVLDREGAVAAEREVGESAGGQLDIEPLAGRADERGRAVGAAVVTWSAAAGRAPAELRFAVVLHTEGGLRRRSDILDADDLAAVLARYDEVCAEVFGPPAADHTAIGLSDRLQDAFARRDWAALEALLAPDVVLLDYRPVVGGETRRGPAAALEVYRSLIDTAPEVEARWEVLAAEPAAVAGVQHYGGQGWENPAGVVRVARDGRFVRIELHEPDRVALLARFGEHAGHPGLVRPAPWMAAHAARDWEALRGLYAPGYSLLDRRSIAWDPWQGDQAALDNHRAVLDVLPDARAVFVPLRWEGEVLGYDVEVGGHDPSGGDVEARMTVVTVTRGGRALIDEVLEPGDEAALAARFEVLRAPAAQAVLDWAERRNAAGDEEWVVPDVVAADDRTARVLLTCGERRTAAVFTLTDGGALRHEEVPGADRDALLAR
jgi:hypothetical protein